MALVKLLVLFSPNSQEDFRSDLPLSMAARKLGLLWRGIEMSVSVLLSRLCEVWLSLSNLCKLRRKFFLRVRPSRLRKLPELTSKSRTPLVLELLDVLRFVCEDTLTSSVWVPLVTNSFWLDRDGQEMAKSRLRLGAERLPWPYKASSTVANVWDLRLFLRLSWWPSKNSIVKASETNG